MKVTVLPRQTISDIAIQIYGDIRAVIDLAVANGIGVTDDIEPGTELECPDVVYDPYVQSYVIRNGISPATGLTEEDIQTRVFQEEFTQEYM